MGLSPTPHHCYSPAGLEFFFKILDNINDVAPIVDSDTENYET